MMMESESLREDDGADLETAHVPPLEGEPEENPETLESRLETSGEQPASPEESPIEEGVVVQDEGETLQAQDELDAAPAEMPVEAPEGEAESAVDAEAEVSEPAAEATAVEAETELDEPAEMAAEAPEGEAEPAMDTEAEVSELAADAPAADAEAELDEPAVTTADAPVVGLAEEDVSVEIDEDGEAEEAPVDEPDDGRLWYVVHCYSGYENKVRHNLEQRIETMGMKDQIFDVVVPTEEEIEVKDGKRRTVERRVFPGYILVQMLLTEESWYVVRNTPGVTGFVGMGNEPTPLRPEEVSQIIKRMEAEAPRIKVTYKQGQKVRIIDGPFNDFIGTVEDIDMERAKVRVMVSFFGRDTPVELDFLQVEKA